MMTNTAAPSARAEEAAPALGPSAITNKPALAMQVASASHHIGLELWVCDLAIWPSNAQAPMVHPSKISMAMVCMRPRNSGSGTNLPNTATIAIPHAPKIRPTDHHARERIRVFDVPISTRLTSQLSGARPRVPHRSYLIPHRLPPMINEDEAAWPIVLIVKNVSLSVSEFECQLPIAVYPNRPAALGRTLQRVNNVSTVKL
jgi:hypothetical protein